jgi:tetratricopeptide (TPR) repeat protein
MSSSKDMAPFPAPVDQDRRRGAWRLAAALLVAAAVSFGVWICLRPSSQALYDRALPLISSHPEEAEALFQKAVARAGGDFPDAQLQLCRLAIRRRDHDALQALCARVDWRAGRSDLLLNLGREAIAASDWDLARRVRAGLAARPPHEAVPALEVLAELYRSQRRPDEELACLEELTTIAPDDRRGWWQLAGAQERRENPADAAEIYRRALECHLPRRDEIEMRHRRVERLLDIGDAAAAGEEIEQLVERDGSQVARIQVHRAHLHRLLGDFQAALADLETVWPQIGEVADAIKFKAILQLDAGQFEDARRGLESVVEAQPFDEVAHFKLAEACRRLGLVDEEEMHRNLHQRIQTARLEIRRLKAAMDRERPTRAACLKLAELHRELEEQDQVTYWTNAARGLE